MKPPSTKVLPSVFTEMLCSFVTLGTTQNLSASVEILQVSRQTIRRHINELEQLKGTRLFHADNRQYRLTRAGEAALVEAQKLIGQSASWLQNQLTTSNGLLSTKVIADEDAWLYAQRHRLLDVWSKAPPILKRGLEAWFQSSGDLDHPALDKIRPYILVYRKYRDEWLLVEFGEKSAYATWLGSSVTKSELGRKLDLGKEYDALVGYWRAAYDQVQVTGGLWYEHIAVSMPRHLGGEPVPVAYQRLIAASKFIDAQPAVVVFAARTNLSDIPNIPADHKVVNAPENLMEFDI